MQVGEKVRFTGHGYRRAKEYQYDKLFGNEVYEIEAVKQSCCNRFLILKGVKGMYCEVFFSKVET